MRQAKLSILVSCLILCLIVAALPASAQTDQFSITYGDTVSDGVPAAGAGNLEVGGALDVYTFNGAAGETAIFDVISNTATLRWTLEAPNGAVLFDVVFADRQLALAQTGTYTLTVMGLGPSTVATYSFRLLLAPAPQAFTISFGDTVSDGVPAPGAGNLEAPGARDVYTFSATAGQLAVLDHLSGSNSQIGWNLQAPNGTTLFDTFINDRQVTLTETGTYILTLRGSGVATFGLYSFSLLLAPEPQYFPISMGDTVSENVPAAGAGNLESPGAQDIYTFDAPAGQQILLDVLSGSNVQIGWQLAAPDGTTLFDTFINDRQITLAQAGTYTLTVRGNNPANTGLYAFQLLPVATPQYFVIGFGDTVSDGVPSTGAGNIETAGALDIYTFDALAGQEAIFDTLAGALSVFRWQLTAPDGSSLLESFFLDFQVALPQTGTYTLTVSGFQLTNTGTYSFQLVEVPVVAQHFTIAFGDTVSDGVPSAGAGNLEVAGTTDVYSFVVTGAQNAVFDVIAGDLNLFQWMLTAPDGTTLFDGLYADRQLALTQNGTYSLTVRGYQSSNTGTYSFQLLGAPLAQVFAIQFGDTVSDGVPGAGAGNLEAPGALDIYTFDAIAGQQAILEHVTGSNLTLGWRLEAPDGSVLFDVLLADRLVALGQDGTYTLTLRGNTPDDFGAYSFTLRESIAVAFAQQPPASVVAGDLFVVELQIIDPATMNPLALDNIPVELILINDATGAVVPGESWSSTTFNGQANVGVTIISGGIYRLRANVTGADPVDSEPFEITQISGIGSAYLPPTETEEPPSEEE